MDITSQLAFEFVAQGIWTSEDMYDFVDDMYSKGYNVGYDVGYDCAEYTETVAITG